MLNLAMLERVAHTADATPRPQQPGKPGPTAPRLGRDLFTRGAPDPLLASALRSLAARQGALAGAEAALAKQLEAVDQPERRQRLTMALTPLRTDMERLATIREAAGRGQAGQSQAPDRMARLAKLVQEAARSLDGAALPRIETRLRLLGSGRVPQRDVLAGVDQLDARLGRLGNQLRRLSRQADVTQSRQELARLGAEHAAAEALRGRLEGARDGLLSLALKPGLGRSHQVEAARIARDLPHAPEGRPQDQLLRRLEQLRGDVG